MPFATMSPALACELLARAGLRCVPAELHVEARDDRWLVRLPGARLAWFAASDEAVHRLAIERRVLLLLESRCSFSAPRVLLDDTTGAFDVRSMVVGDADPWRLYRELRDDAAIARRVGIAIGEILAQQHGRIHEADVADWLPRRPSWPQSRAWITERLPAVVDDAELRAHADEVLSAYDDVCVLEHDRVLCHGDVGLHNLGVDPTTFTVHGLFDYDDAAWADRHHDFRYLVFDHDRDELLDGACSSYEPAVGHAIRRDRVLLYNAACALTFLAFRMGTRPEARSCGRTLAEDLRWSRLAIARLSGSSPAT